MVVLDHDGFVLYVNLAAESLFSLPSAEMVGANFGFPIIMDKPVELHILREFKDFVGAEMRMVEVKWAGEPSYLLSFRDLTDRINAEQALSRSRDELDAKVNVRTQELSETNESLKREIAERKFIEERLAYVASFPELNPNPLFEMDKSGVIKYSNPAANRIFPDLREKGMDHPLLRGITFGVFKEKREIVRDVYINDTAYQQSIYYLADRKTLRIYIRDITERKRAEDALREQSILLNLSPDGIIARNLDGKIAFWSKGAEALYGWKEQEAIGQVTHFLLKTVFPCTLEDINRGLLQTGGWSGELAHTAKDGRQIIVQSSWLVRYDDKGNIKNILESNVNITERKQAEEKLLEAKQQAELYLDLMGHDINNMHQIALGYLEIAQELIQADEAQKELLDKPVEVLQRSARLIQNVRKLQKINEGVCQSKEVDVCQMLVDVQRELARSPTRPSR
jgi:PAS domain S-box-containing protein